MCALRISEPQSLLACQHALDPAPLIGPWWLEGRKQLREPPKAGILADVIFDEKALKRLTSSSGEEEYSLMDAVEHRRRSYGWRAWPTMAWRRLCNAIHTDFLA